MAAVTESRWQRPSRVNPMAAFSSLGIMFALRALCTLNLKGSTFISLFFFSEVRGGKLCSQLPHLQNGDNN